MSIKKDILKSANRALASIDTLVLATPENARRIQRIKEDLESIKKSAESMEPL